MGNVIEMPMPNGIKDARRLEVEAVNAKLDRLKVSGRHYLTPATRTHTRIPPMLHVRVGKGGSKAFAISIRVRDTKTGKPSKRRDMTLGRYPALELGEAIERGWELVRAAERGEDPSAERVRYRELAATVPTMDALLDDYEAANPKGNKTITDIVKAIKRALPEEVLFKSAALVNRDEIVGALKAVARRGQRPTAVRTHSYISAFRSWIITEEDFEIEDWLAGYKPTAERVQRTRVLSWEELDLVLNAAEAHLKPYWSNLIKLLVLSGVRRDEAANARWSEIDLQAREWRIPAERMKAKEPHTVPLSKEMIAVLKAQKAWQKDAGYKTQWIFTSTGETPVQGHSKMKASLGRYCDVKDWVIHDFRRSLATLLCDDLGFDDDLADRMLAHKRRGVAGTYNRASRLDQRRKAHEVWSAAVMGTGSRSVDE